MLNLLFIILSQNFHYKTITYKHNNSKMTFMQINTTKTSIYGGKAFVKHAITTDNQIIMGYSVVCINIPCGLLI